MPREVSCALYARGRIAEKRAAKQNSALDALASIGCPHGFSHEVRGGPVARLASVLYGAAASPGSERSQPIACGIPISTIGW